MLKKNHLLYIVFILLATLSFANNEETPSHLTPLKSRSYSKESIYSTSYQDPSRIYLESGSIWVTESFAEVNPELKVSSSEEVIVKNGKIAETINFNIKTNYSYYINKYELSIYDGKGGVLSQPLKVIEGAPSSGDFSVEWDGITDLKKNYRNGDQLIYRLKVYDKNNNIDSTNTGVIDIVSRKVIPDFNDFQKNFYAEEKNMGEANLLVQNIPLNFGMVKIAGTNFKDLDKVVVRGEEYDLDENRLLVLEYLPSGEYDIPVKLVYKDDREEEYILKATVPEKYSFTTGIADFLIGENHVSGNRETLGDADAYKNSSIYNEARLALYNKTKFSDKFRVTAQINTQQTEYDKLFDNLNDRDNKTIFDRVEDFDEIYYPTYGDESYIYRDVNTQSKFYVKAEYSKSQFLWGNYNTGLTGTKFMQYNRSFYGGKGIYRTDETTKFGDDRVSLTGFISDVDSLYSHEEFLGTGGSLYFLKYGDVVMGSEKVSVKVVDKTTNLTKSLTPLQEGRDYEFDAYQGRVILNKPLNTMARENNSSDIIHNNPGGDEYSYLVIDYEYLPTGADYDENSTYGLRTNAWLNDHVGVGLTNIKDTQDVKDYEMKGGTVTLKATENSYVIVEASETTGSNGGGNYLSYDGGISFNKIKDTSDDQKGNAYNIIGNLNLYDVSPTMFSAQGDQVTGWYQEKDKEYSYASTDNDHYLETYGAEVKLKLTTDLNLKTKYNNQLEKDYSGNEITKLEESQVELEYALTDRIVTGVALKEVEELRDGKVGNATLGGAKVQYEINDDSSVFVEGQSELEKDSNYDSNSIITLGGETKLTEKLTADARTSAGSRGNYQELGSTYKLTDDHDLYLGYVVDEDEEDLSKVTAGQKLRMSDKLDVYQENQFAKDNNGKGRIGSYGAEYEYKDDYKIGGAFQHGTVDLPDGQGKNKRNGVSLFSKIDDNQLIAKNKIEYRQDDGDKDIKQYLTTNNFKYILSNEYTVLSKINYSLTTSDSEKDATFAQLSIGLAYRPIYYDRLNFLSRYTLILEDDNGATGYYNNSNESARNREYENVEAHVFEFETVYIHTPKWSYSLKQAYRYEDKDYFRDDNTTYNLKNNIYLTGLRATYKVMKEWEVFAEYHWLVDKQESDVLQGAIVGVSKHINDNLKMGGGYNFSGFADDLKRDDYDSHGWFFSMTGIL